MLLFKLYHKKNKNEFKVMDNETNISKNKIKE